MIGKSGCATSQQLSCDVIPSSSIRQRLREVNNFCTKLEQSLFEIIHAFARRHVLAIRNLGNAPFSEFNVRRFLLHNTTGLPSVIISTFSSTPRARAAASNRCGGS